ncbi:DUF899 domain-containing protein [Streptomyces sp. NPDC005811]|uniref:DUF899 domain-containing protein n=1 Tax=Streptomyces sp. NPDC005811 TaxID=3154565 RepID=UPI0033D0677D
MAHPELPGLPEIVSRAAWRAARAELLAEEEAVARAREALTVRRRRLPMVEIGTEYVFEGDAGKATLLDLFDGHGQLVLHHFRFAPEWEEGCPHCSAFLDQLGHLAHLRARGVSFAAVSRAPYPRLLQFKARMGWMLPWYSSYTNDFNRDFEATREQDGALVERPGLSCFLRDGDRVFHTYSVHGDGLDGLGSLPGLLDLTALEPPAGAPVRHHDAYDL